ncbi:MAG: MarR family transcriptional regulator, partial [Candidatus Thorarchaeota archaeon]|nr:MarR family transcriptional regulator [Candidatus Thorarchaeota archaeon]
ALLGVLLGIVLAVFGPRILYRLRRIGKVRFIGVTSEEEDVLEVIRQKGGSCPQKDLYTEFDMSQAKVSLILNNLEERGLVRRLREGRENVVHIMES